MSSSRMVLLFATVFLPALVPACVEHAPAEEPASVESAARVKRTPQLSHLPPGSDDFYDGGCVAGRIPGCTLLTHSGQPALAKAKQIYDRFFGAGRPRELGGFGWTGAPDLESTIDTVRLPRLPWGSVDEVKSWISLSPETPRFTRGDTRSNVAIFEELRATSPELLEDDRSAQAYERYNANDFVPAALTHYQTPTATSDIMATNFMYRIVKQPWRMERALADCTSDPDVPCVDAVAALSDVDIGRVLDVRFIRWVDGRALLSRRMRVVVVDSGHAVQSQAVRGPNANGSPHLMTNHGAGPKLLWRAEIGGSLAQLLDTGPGASGALVAYSSANGKGDADEADPSACTDLVDGTWRCANDDAGIMKTWKCTGLAWTPASWGCDL